MAPTVTIPDRWSTNMSLVLAEPNPEFGTVQLTIAGSTIDVDITTLFSAMATAVGVVVLDPNNETQLTKFYTLLLDGANGENAFQLDNITNALFKMIEPPRPPDEPMTLSDRVIDKEGYEWARNGDGLWACLGHDSANVSWVILFDGFGPLTIIQQ